MELKAGRPAVPSFFFLVGAIVVFYSVNDAFVCSNTFTPVSPEDVGGWTQILYLQTHAWGGTPLCGWSPLSSASSVVLRVHICQVAL